MLADNTDIKCLGEGEWKRKEHGAEYSRRSLAGTKMHCFQRLGERVKAHSFEHQVVDLDIRVALLNRLSQIGRPQTVSMEAVA